MFFYFKNLYIFLISSWKFVFFQRGGGLFSQKNSRELKIKSFVGVSSELVSTSLTAVDSCPISTFFPLCGIMILMSLESTTLSSKHKGIHSFTWHVLSRTLSHLQPPWMQYGPAQVDQQWHVQTFRDALEWWKLKITGQNCGLVPDMMSLCLMEYTLT